MTRQFLKETDSPQCIPRFSMYCGTVITVPYNGPFNF